MKRGRLAQRSLELVLACLVFSGCALFERSAACTTRKLLPPERLGVVSEQDRPDFCHYHGALARWYVPYAIMSLNTYRPDGLDDAAADGAESCRDGDHKVLCPAPWQRSRGKHDVEADNRATGLFMESFQRSDGRHVEFVIAFRGTEWRSLEDWRANLRWVMPGLRTTDEYPRARRKSVKWVAEVCQGIGRTYESLTVIMTGHSLGGGLAQSAAYAVQRALAPGLVPQDGGLSWEEREAQELLAGCPYAKVQVQVVAFDPSPVTGYRDGQALAKCENPLSKECRRPIVMRLYEKGEILAYPRRVLSWFNPLATNICEDRYYFADGRLPVGLHQMRRIASGLIWLAKETGDVEAATIYSRYCPVGNGAESGPLLCSAAKFDCPLQKAS